MTDALPCVVRLLACTFMVVLASTTPALQSLVPDTYELLEQVAVAVEPWASADSSAKTIVWFVHVIRQKLRHCVVDRVNADR